MPPTLPDGIVAFVKSSCPTCQLVAPVLADLQADGGVTVVSQDDPTFPPGVTVVDDRLLELSWHADLDTVPTLVRITGGTEVARTVGWSRDGWQTLSGRRDLGSTLPPQQPG